MQREAAEMVAVRVLAWLARNDDLMQLFLNASGCGAEDLRAQAADPAFLVSVLDFLMMDDAWIVAYCAAEGLANDVPMRARQALPGGGEVHWT